MGNSWGESRMQRISVVLFDQFTILDAFGPINVFAMLKDRYAIELFSLRGGIVRTQPGLHFATRPFDEVESTDLLLVPGGFGTRGLVGDEEFLAELRSLIDCSTFVLSVCTGSALLAKAGALTGRKATSNKLAFDWAASQDPSVEWVRRARWVADGKFYTSSGVSAGIDMALGFVGDQLGLETARKLATAMEYPWTENAQDDPFAE